MVRLFLFFTLVSTTFVYATDTLSLIGDISFPTGEKFQETEIGGLSGIAYDREQNKLLAVSDDKSQVNETRFYEFDVALTDKKFSLKPASVVKLKNKAGTFFSLGAVDFEGIAFYGKDILISSEGAIEKENILPSELYRFSRNGDFKELLPIPEKFLPAQKNYGARFNKSFEALSTSLDGKTIYLGAEEALFQDGEVASSISGSNVRIVIYKNLKPKMEIAYALEKVDTEVTPGKFPGDNGLVDIAAIDDKSFYTLERSYLPSINKNVIRIFKCIITNKTTDISKMDSLKGQTFTTVQKTLVADLDQFLPQMNPAKLDNIEGIVLGPILSNKNRTLIVVSDNNFSPTQRTLFMAFEIKN